MKPPIFTYDRQPNIPRFGLTFIPIPINISPSDDIGSITGNYSPTLD